MSLLTKGRVPSKVAARLSRGLASVSTTKADYVIVGAGSAGCVLANRLSADPSTSVAVFEAGPSDRNKWDLWKISMPAALTYNLADTKYNWGYETVPQAHMGGRALDCPRGRVLGGSSSLYGLWCTCAVILWISTAGQKRVPAMNGHTKSACLILKSTSAC